MSVQLHKVKFRLLTKNHSKPNPNTLCWHLNRNWVNCDCWLRPKLGYDIKEPVESHMYEPHMDHVKSTFLRAYILYFKPGRLIVFVSHRNDFKYTTKGFFAKCHNGSLNSFSLPDIEERILRKIFSWQICICMVVMRCLASSRVNLLGNAWLRVNDTEHGRAFLYKSAFHHHLGDAKLWFSVLVVLWLWSAWIYIYIYTWIDWGRFTPLL